MNIPQWFRRTRPEPAPIIISRTDLAVASAHNLSAAEWDALPAVVKADLREQVTYADGFRR